MIDQFINLRPDITELLTRTSRLSEARRTTLEPKVFNISNEEWSYLPTVRDLLRILREATLALQAHKSLTVSFTIPYVHRILEELEDWQTKGFESSNPLIALGLEMARQKLLSYYPIQGEDISSIKNLYLASVLDPRLKWDVFKELGYSLG